MFKLYRVFFNMSLFQAYFLVFFLAKSVHIMFLFISSSTAKHPFFVKEIQQHCTSLRDLTKDTLLRDRERRKKPSTTEDLNP